MALRRFPGCNELSRRFITRFVPLIALSLLLASNAPKAQQRIAQAIVVTQVSIDAPEPTSALTLLLPSMVVDVYARTDHALLVRRQFNLSAKGWIKLDAVIEPSAFRPVSQWPGRKRHEIYSDSGDSGRTYDLGADGSFRSRHSTSAGDTWDEGTLYRHGAVIWARPKRAKLGELDPWAFFHIGQDGSLCTFSDEGYCPGWKAPFSSETRNRAPARKTRP